MNLQRTNRRWEALAREDPLWAIASDPDKRGNRWDPEAFFASGRSEVAAILEHLQETGTVPASGRALDFGCGFGRLSQALADHFDRVDGIDAAPSMIDGARRYDSSDGRCRFHLVEAPPLPFADGDFDMVLSLVTLQHIPPGAARRYLAELIRVLGADGIAVLQLAAEPILPIAGWRSVLRRNLPGWALELWRNLRHSLKPPADFEIHGLARGEVEAIVIESGGQVLEAAEDRAAGSGWRSYSYVIRR